MIILAKLVASECDPLGYITYVFKCLDPEISKISPYCMVVRYPNWDSKNLKIGDEGYLHYEEIRAGIDKWYDGNNMVPYKYNSVQFIKFIPKEVEESHKYVM